MLKFVTFVLCLALANSALIPVGYKFGYNIDSSLDGQSREESRDENGNVVGFYTIRDADGRARRVNYKAGADGFHAEIDSNEPGVLSKSSANARYNGDELPTPSPLSASLPVDLPASGEILVPTGYKFGYDVQGPSDSHSREESSDNGKVSGAYSLKDADGQTRRVEYTADSQGFKATIHTNEPGTANNSPADVVLNSPHAAPVPVEPLSAPTAGLSYSPSLSQSIVHELPESRPLALEPLRAPVQQEYLKTPLSQELVSAPVPSEIYTSKSHSSIIFSKAPEPAPAPVAAPQDPIEQVYERPKEIVQEIRQEPLPVKSAPVEQKYTSSVHSSIKYIKKLEVPAEPTLQEIKQDPLPTRSSPVVQELKQDPLPVKSTPVLQELRQDPLPVKSTPVVQEYKKETLPVKSAPTPAPVYQSRVYSSIQYTKRPAIQEQLSVKTESLATKEQSAELLAVTSAPATKSFTRPAETKSFGARLQPTGLKSFSKSL